MIHRGFALKQSPKGKESISDEESRSQCDFFSLSVDGGHNRLVVVINDVSTSMSTVTPTAFAVCSDSYILNRGCDRCRPTSLQSGVVAGLKARIRASMP